MTTRWLAVLALVVLATPVVSAGELEDEGPVRSTYGVTFGLPGGFNLVTSQYFGGKLGVRGSVGYVPGREGDHMFGAQIGVVRKANEAGRTLYDVSVVAGYHELITASSLTNGGIWRYVGVTGSIATRGFFLEAGLTVGSGDYRNPQGTLHLGYLFSVNRSEK